MFPYEDSKIVSVCLYPEICLYPEKRNNHLSFVNISTTVAINASKEMSSQLLQHGNPKIWISFQNMSKLNFDL